jgi:hypothetical protein
MRCIRGLAYRHINKSRRKIAVYPFSKLSNPAKILRFISKRRVTEIWGSSAVKADSESISDIPQNRRFHVAENFVVEQMYRRNGDL